MPLKQGPAGSEGPAAITIVKGLHYEQFAVYVIDTMIIVSLLPDRIRSGNHTLLSLLMYSKSESLIHRAEQIRSRGVPSLHRVLKRPKSSVASVLGLIGKPAGFDLRAVVAFTPWEVDCGALRFLLECIVLLLGWLY